MRMVFADRLLDFTEKHAVEIARLWWDDVRTNPRTPSYHSAPESKHLPQGLELCRELKRIYHSDKPYEEEMGFFTSYAEQARAERIPLHEAIYALILLRRRMWLHAESQAVFTSALDLHQAVESINRIVLLYDYAVYIVTKTHLEK